MTRKIEILIGLYFLNYKILSNKKLLIDIEIKKINKTIKTDINSKERKSHD